MTKHDTILMVDQDSELVSILSTFLNLRGFQVLFTTRVQEAITKINAQKFAHIFIDPNLELDNALDLFALLNQAEGPNATTPVSIMTSKKDHLIPVEFVTRLRAILIKPFTLEEFAYRLDSPDQESPT